MYSSSVSTSLSLSSLSLSLSSLSLPPSPSLSSLSPSLSYKLDHSFMTHFDLFYANVLCDTDEKPFQFTTLLHTYFRVPDVTKTTVSGFSGLTYVDKVILSEMWNS